MGGPSAARHPRWAGEKCRQMIAEADHPAIIVALVAVIVAARLRHGDRHHIAIGVHGDRPRPCLAWRLGRAARRRLLGGFARLGRLTLPRLAIFAVARPFGRLVARAPAAIAAAAARFLVGEGCALDAVDGAERD